MTRHALTLPQFVRDLLASPPRRGGGLNLWFYRVARVLHPYRGVLHPVYVTRKLLYRLSEIEALEADGTGGPDE